LSPAARSPEEFEAALRAIGEERYHHRHPFNLRMHAGTLTQQEIRTWVANRYYYQTRIPIKDGMILSKSQDPNFRREWVGRIHDHDGRKPGEGGLELWLALADAVGLDREQVESLRDVLPGVRRACDAYVEFVESHDLLESVASSLTELFAGDIMQVRIAAFEEHYPWVSDDGLRYFRSRTTQAPSDAKQGLAHVKRDATTAEDQEKCLAALTRKCEILWGLLDAIEAAHDRPRLSAHAQLRDDPDGAMLVLPERAVKVGGSGSEILALCDGEAMTRDIAAAFAAKHPDAESASDDAHDFIDEMRKAGVLEVAN
jgi:pyrroloquinoline-quinone synthase